MLKGEIRKKIIKTRINEKTKNEFLINKIFTISKFHLNYFFKIKKNFFN